MAEKNVYTVTYSCADLYGERTQGLVINKNDSQLIYGEEFRAQKQHGEWLKGVSVIDGYEGYIHESLLIPKIDDPTHLVSVPLTHIYPEPSFKTRPIMTLSFLSRVIIEDKEQDGFVETLQGWVFKDHVKTLDEMPKNRSHLDTAMMFMGTPYLYGGRTALGLDCSALVQLSLLACAENCPRDSGQQANVIGQKISEDELTRGDLVFFEGHVGIMTSERDILNATARSMDTRIEPLDNLKEFYGDVTNVRRLLT